jgi:hypothetical protein
MDLYPEVNGLNIDNLQGIMQIGNCTIMVGTHLAGASFFLPMSW